MFDITKEIGVYIMLMNVFGGILIPDVYKRQLILLVAVGIICWIYMSLLLVVTEEKWLRDLYGKQYEDYCNRVNKCIPWFRNKVL